MAIKKESIHITEAEFAAIKPLLVDKISTERIEIAYLTLVHGKGFSDVARQFGKSRQFAFLAAERVKKTYIEYKTGQESYLAMIKDNSG